MDKINTHKRLDTARQTYLIGKGKLLIFALALSQLAGCVKDDLYNTPHPDKGAVQVTTDWTGRSSDALLPDSYILRIGSGEQTVSGETNVFKPLFLPGTQSLLVYHQPEGITINGTTATVNTLADGTLTPMPGFLFSAAKELAIQKDDTLKVTVPMMQRIRTLKLNLMLNPGDGQRIAGTSATLTGIAPAVDMATGSLTATEGKTIAPVFVLTTDATLPDNSRRATDNGMSRATGIPILAAELHLLGIAVSATQQLTLTVTLTDGTVQAIATDLTDALKDFSSGKLEPLQLDATLTLPSEAGFSATISDWNVLNNGDITVN